MFPEQTYNLLCLFLKDLIFMFEEAIQYAPLAQSAALRAANLIIEAIAKEVISGIPTIIQFVIRQG